MLDYIVILYNIFPTSAVIMIIVFFIAVQCRKGLC